MDSGNKNFGKIDRTVIENTANRVQAMALVRARINALRGLLPVIKYKEAKLRDLLQEYELLLGLIDTNKDPNQWRTEMARIEVEYSRL